MSSPPAPPPPAFSFLQEAPAPSSESPSSPSSGSISPGSASPPTEASPPAPSPFTASSLAPSSSSGPLLSPPPYSSDVGHQKSPSSLPAPALPISQGGSSGGGSKSVSVGVPVGVVLVVLLLLGVAGVYWFKKKRRQAPPLTDKGVAPPPSPGKDQEPAGGAMSPQPLLVNVDHHVVKISPDPYPPLPSPPRSEVPAAPPVPLGSARSCSFTYEELEKATDGFSSANYLGHGGFGYVHRGVLPDGVEVAVKQLSARSFQGDREFQAEVEVISRVHHKHLVSLIGYCVSEGRRLLVYEFVPNKTLEFHLHVKEGPAMDWPTRLKIALGSGKGLAYLHEDCRPKIIHRDIKAANILLDEKFEPMVADFGLAKFASDSSSHVSTRVMGTFGYLAPEYASSGKLTDKSDVFSYGVMLLELITGRRPTDTISSSKDDNLVDWARPLLTRVLSDGNYDLIVDPKLNKEYNRKSMTRMISCTAACVRHSARRRPRISLVVRVLEGEASLDDLNEGIKPGQSEIYSLQDGADPESLKYGEVMKNFKNNTLGSGENASSEATSTNEYAMNLSVTSSEERQEQEIEKKKVD